MPFVKLDCDILDSSLWLFDPERILFLTALCMATPQEFDKPLEQISVHNLHPTGFVAPPGWYGFLRASPMSLIERAKVGGNSDVLERAFEALEELGEADVDSRSHAFEGRRLIRIDGGFVVLRFMEFRDHDYKNAERQRRWRERERERKSNGVTSVTSNGSNTPERVTVTQAEDRSQKTEAEAERKQREREVADAPVPLVLISDSLPKQKRKFEKQPKGWDEFLAFCEKNEVSRNDAEYLYNRWNASGWKINKQPIESWKHAVRSWKTAGYLPSQKPK